MALASDLTARSYGAPGAARPPARPSLTVASEVKPPRSRCRNRSESARHRAAEPPSMRSTHVVAARALLLLAALASTAAAHGGIYRGPQPGPPPTSTPPTPGGPPPTAGRVEVSPVPGSPPSLVFSEERWEFWWEFNHDAWVNLRPSLLNAP